MRQSIDIRIAALRALITVGTSALLGLNGCHVARQPYPSAWPTSVLAPSSSPATGADTAAACPSLDGAFANRGEAYAPDRRDNMGKKLPNAGPVWFAELLSPVMNSGDIRQGAAATVIVLDQRGEDSLVLHLPDSTAPSRPWLVLTRAGTPRAARTLTFRCAHGTLTLTRRQYASEQFVGVSTLRFTLARGSDGSLIVKRTESAYVLAMLLIPLGAYERSWARFPQVTIGAQFPSPSRAP